MRHLAGERALQARRLAALGAGPSYWGISGISAGWFGCRNLALIALAFPNTCSAGNYIDTMRSVTMRLGNCIQTLQSLCELFNVVTRKSGIEIGAAAAFVNGWQSVTLVEAPTPADLGDAMRAVAAYRIGFWDAMLWATARRAGVRILFSEDFRDRQTIEGVRILNPFAPHNVAQIKQALRQ